MMICYELEICRGGSVYTIGIGKHCQSQVPLPCPQPGELVYHPYVILPEGNAIGRRIHGASTLFVMLWFKEFLKQIWHQDRLWYSRDGSWVFIIVCYAFLYFGNISWKTKSSQLKCSGQYKTISFLASLILQI